VASSTASGSSAPASTSDSPRWPCLSGALTTSAARNRSRRRETSCQRGSECRLPRAVRAGEACSSRAPRSPARADAAARAAPRAAQHATGQSVPGAITPSRSSAAGEPLDRRLVLGGDDAAAVGQREPRGARIAVGNRRSRNRGPPRRFEGRPSCAGPAPRTRTRGLPLARIPRHQDSFSRYHRGRCVRGPSAKDVRARQSMSSAARSVNRMCRSTWPGRSST